MGFKQVYSSLQELFPQIDARALRAVAIEHSKDVDAAVLAVLEEIIPFLAERSTPSSPLTQSISTGESSEEALVRETVGTQTNDWPYVDTVGSAQAQNIHDVDSGKQPLGHAEALLRELVGTQINDWPYVDTEGSAQEQNVHNVDSGKQQPLGDADDGPSEPFYDAYDGHHVVQDNIAELTLSEKTFKNKMKMSADVYSHGESVVLIDENGVDTHKVELSGDPQPQETISGDKCPESFIKISSAGKPLHQSVGSLQEVDMGVGQKMNLLQENEDIAGHSEAKFGTACTDENDLEKSSADVNNSVDETASEIVHDINVRPLESSAQPVDVPHVQESNLDDLNICLSTDGASNPETMSNIVGTEDDSTLNATMSQSSQIRVIDAIEEIIAVARNNKKTLFMAMESVISLMSQVELKEQAAEQAKVEAAMGGTDILNNVEELKTMLQYAKEANDMHAGEVYGEKAILTTELRELQSRVCSLSDERDKSLAVLDEMRQILEVRLAAAENEIKSAEQEKLEKEKAARVTLADQELIMEKVVQESKILKQQAEDNAKLQEFLVDRGRVVDTLQGEIAVICQDVRLLKEKFDQHLPLSKSLFSSQTSFILASSNSSLKSLVPDQVQAVPVGDDDYSSLKSLVPDQMQAMPVGDDDYSSFKSLVPDQVQAVPVGDDDYSSLKSLVPDQVQAVPVGDDDLLETQKNKVAELIPEEGAARDDRKALQDDGWEIFDKGEIIP